MLKNFKERLVDVVMGEAILELVEADKPISVASLVTQLKEDLLLEESAARREAIQAAIGEVYQKAHLRKTAEKKVLWHARAEERPSFNSDPPAPDVKKH